LGFAANIGVAPTPLAARLFACADAKSRPVRGCLKLADLAERVADLPLFLLDWPADVLARLTDLGLLRVRDVAAIPAEGLARRFGPRIALDLERLLGRVADPREPYKPPDRFRSRLELPADVEGVEALLFPLKRLLVELEGSLRGRGAGVQRLELLLEHGRSASTRVELDFASPEREADFILGIAREKLGRLTLPAATCGLELRADALLPYTPRLGTWLPGSREQAIGRERLQERLAARMGKERVFGIALADDHRPERDWKAVGTWAPDGSRVATRRTRPRQGHSGAGSVGCPISSHCPSPLRPTWLLPRPHKLLARDGVPHAARQPRIASGPRAHRRGLVGGR
jgi:protein ImuB